MEDDYSDIESIITPEGMSQLANSNCGCGYDGFCYCFSANTCWCFGNPEDNAPFRLGDVEEHDAVGDIDSGATEQGLSILRLPGIGRLRLEDTSGEDNLCGMFALEISTEQQLGVALTPDIFWEIFRNHPEMQAFNEERNCQNLNNFYDDQLARVLEIWGRQYGYEKLQLGVIVEGSWPIIFGAGDKCVLVLSEEVLDNERDFKTIWIYNDNAAQLYGAGMSHYSGVTVIELNEEQDESSEGGGSTEEGDTTEEESATETPGDDAEAG